MEEWRERGEDLKLAYFFPGQNDQDSQGMMAGVGVSDNAVCGGKEVRMGKSL